MSQKELKKCIRCRLYSENIINIIRDMNDSKQRKSEFKKFLKIAVIAMRKQQCSANDIVQESNTSRLLVDKTIKRLKELKACTIAYTMQNNQEILKFNISRYFMITLLFLFNDLRCPELISGFEEENSLKPRLRRFYSMLNTTKKH